MVQLGHIRWYVKDSGQIARTFLTLIQVLGELCFGESFGSVEARKTNEWVATILNMVIFVSWSCALGHVSPLLEKMVWVLSPPSVRKAALNHIEKSQAKIQARIDRGEGERKDFCSYIFELRDQMGLNDWHMTSYSNTLIIAGSETTATTLSVLTYWLCRTPRVYEKLKQEVRSRYNSSSEITSQSATFPYLTAVINEILRLVPPMPFGTPRVVPKGGETVDEVLIPEGVSLRGFLLHKVCVHRGRADFAYLRQSSASTATAQRVIPNTSKTLIPSSLSVG